MNELDVSSQSSQIRWWKLQKSLNSLLEISYPSRLKLSDWANSKRVANVTNPDIITNREQDMFFLAAYKVKNTGSARIKSVRLLGP